MKIVSLLFIVASTLQGSNTEVLFQPNLPTVGPFPTNFLTTSTFTQKTGLQVNLPLPAGCSIVSASTPCVNTLEENQLDGFSVNPRITICFSGPVNPATLQGGITISPVASPSSIIKINQILFDPAG